VAISEQPEADPDPDRGADGASAATGDTDEVQIVVETQYAGRGGWVTATSQRFAAATVERRRGGFAPGCDLPSSFQAWSGARRALPRRGRR
jgi:hypothetical protein